MDDSSSLVATITAAYRHTSRRLLDVLTVRYGFTGHLKAMRRYLLLGQGDFIQHLIDLLEPELERPASQLFVHNLTGQLESAVRATNAQYESRDVLDRLDVRLLETSPGDCGWDVFSLMYRVDGPLKTVFTPENVLQYLTSMRRHSIPVVLCKVVNNWHATGL